MTGKFFNPAIPTEDDSTRLTHQKIDGPILLLAKKRIYMQGVGFEPTFQRITVLVA
jgi:hypothetical protein